MTSKRGIDFEVHKHVLEFERKWIRRGGLALIILGSIMGCAGVIALISFFFLFGIPPLQAGGLWFILGALVVITLASPASLISEGSKMLHKGEQPIADAEVQARRQTERTQLFAQAQGELPEEYTPRGRRNALLLGGGIILFSAIVLVTFWRQPFPLSLFGYLFGIGGMLMGLLMTIGQVLAYNQKAANVLQQQSAQMLRQGIAAERPDDSEASTDPE